MKNFFIYVIFFVVIIAIAVAAFVIQEHLYNDGICPDCNEEYETRSVISNGNEKIIVTCRNCPRFYYINPAVVMSN